MNGAGGLEPLTARDASSEITNLALALDFTSPDPSLPALPVIAEPPTDSWILEDIFGFLDTGEKVVNTSKALEVARAANSTGQDNESYDFYLLLKSDRTQGWAIPESLKEK